MTSGTVENVPHGGVETYDHATGMTTIRPINDPNSVARAAFLSGSWQSGSGTAGPLPDAFDPDHPSAFDTVTTQQNETVSNGGETRSLVHDEAPDLAAAALAANAQPAPSHPLEQMMQSLHARVTQLEDIAASPDVMAEISSLKTTVHTLMDMLEKHAPLFDKMWHLFNVHWAGKLPG